MAGELNSSNQSLQIEIFSDVICPWCFIGKRRLDRALTEMASADGVSAGKVSAGKGSADKGSAGNGSAGNGSAGKVPAGKVPAEKIELRWRPYQLYPQIPTKGVDRGEYLRRRYGAEADRSRVPERIRSEAEQEGIELRFDLIEKTPNTLLAHRLLEFAYPGGLQHVLSEALFSAYFCQGVDVGELASLLQVADEVGLDPTAAAAYLSTDEGSEALQAQLQRAPEIGISGVPGYYIANRFLLPGAQTSETMAQIIGRVRTRLVQKQAVAKESG